MSVIADQGQRLPEEIGCTLEPGQLPKASPDDKHFMFYFSLEIRIRKDSLPTRRNSQCCLFGSRVRWHEACAVLQGDQRGGRAERVEHDNCDLRLK